MCTADGEFLVRMNAAIEVGMRDVAESRVIDGAKARAQTLARISKK